MNYREALLEEQMAGATVVDKAMIETVYESIQQQIKICELEMKAEGLGDQHTPHCVRMYFMALGAMVAYNAMMQGGTAIADVLTEYDKKCGAADLMDLAQGTIVKEED